MGRSARRRDGSRRQDRAPPSTSSRRSPRWPPRPPRERCRRRRKRQPPRCRRRPRRRSRRHRPSPARRPLRRGRRRPPSPRCRPRWPPTTPPPQPAMPPLPAEPVFELLPSPLLQLVLAAITQAQMGTLHDRTVDTRVPQPVNPARAVRQRATLGRRQRALVVLDVVDEAVEHRVWWLTFLAPPNIG